MELVAFWSKNFFCVSHKFPLCTLKDKLLRYDMGAGYLTPYFSNQSSVLDISELVLPRKIKCPAFDAVLLYVRLAADEGTLIQV
jgi:hypothetical protein